jgi:Rad3-related DNA helicase
VVAFYYRKDDPGFAGTKKRARYFLTIKSYFVAPIIRKAFGQNVIAYSATIGNPDIWKHETGLRFPFRTFGSNFSSSRTRVFMPTDTPNLSAKSRRRDDVKKALKLIADSAKIFAVNGRRSLVVVVSEEERMKFAKYAEERGLAVVTYGNGVKAREASATFVAGTGDVLLGTVSHFGEGIDLPRGIAPVIFFLRPGYASPDNPETQFEQRRFGMSHCWALWNWRVMIEALQVRGRNIRTARDLGVCFFISAQFRRFLYAGLPEWLRPASKSNVTMTQAIDETLRLLE